MNTDFVNDLKKILGLPEKNPRPKKPANQPRILANTGRFIYKQDVMPEKQLENTETEQPTTPQTPPNWQMPPLCNLYAPSDPKKQCICVYFRSADLPACGGTSEQVATMSEEDYIFQNAAFMVKGSGSKSVTYYEDEFNAYAWKYVEKLDKPLGGKEFYSWLPPETRDQLKADYESGKIPYETWQNKYSLDAYTGRKWGGSVSRHIGNVIGFDNLLPEFEKVAPFLTDGGIADAIRAVLRDRSNFIAVYDPRDNSRYLELDMSKPAVQAVRDTYYNNYDDDEREYDYQRGTGANNIGNAGILAEVAKRQWNTDEGLDAYSGKFELQCLKTMLPAPTRQVSTDTLSPCVSLIATPRGFQTACPSDPRIPELLKGQWFASVRLMTEQDESIRFMRWSMGWAIEWRGFTTVLNIVNDEIKVIQVL